MQGRNASKKEQLQNNTLQNNSLSCVTGEEEAVQAFLVRSPARCLEEESLSS
jgi:hypothetical protein